MDKMLVKETFINATQGYEYGESHWYEPYTEDRGDLYREMQKEYGRCISKVYVEIPGESKPRPVGWVFEKRMRYEDARGNDPEKDYYLREVWVTIAKSVTRTTDIEY